MEFFEYLDFPQLDFLQLVFPIETTGKMLVDVVAAAKSSCQLQKLAELALSSNRYVSPYGMRPVPVLTSRETKKAINMLLPMTKLKVLRLGVTPSFLDVLDLQLYKSMADGLLSLEKLEVNHKDFSLQQGAARKTDYERIRLDHLAAFCHMLPSLKVVVLGSIDYLALEETPYTEWACPSVESLTLMHRSFIGGWDMPVKLRRSLQVYFPQSDFAKIV